MDEIYGGDLYLNSFSCLLSPTEKFSSVMRYNFFSRRRCATKPAKPAIQASSQRVSQHSSSFGVKRFLSAC